MASHKEVLLASADPKLPTATQKPKRFDFPLVAVSSPSGKLDAKEATKVKAHIMRQIHRQRRSGKSTEMVDIVPEIQSPLGAGRCDPFLRLQMKTVPRRYHELMDYCVTSVWSKIRDIRYTHAYAREWLSIASQNPAVLHVFLFAASSHQETYRSDLSSLDSRKSLRLEQLQQKGEAILAIHDALSGNSKFGQSDALIQSILFLAVSETQESDGKADWSPFLAPLRTLEWLNIYGSRTLFMPHLVTVQHLIKKRGGIRNLHAMGLAWMISCSELIAFSQTLDKPQYPLLNPHGHDVEYLPFAHPPTLPPSQLLPPTPGLSHLQPSGSLKPEIMNVLWNARYYSQAIERHENSTLLPVSMGDNRNWVLHKLLSLPSASDLLLDVNASSNDFEKTVRVYDACRLGLLMYGIHVIYPTPRSLSPRGRLLPLLQNALQEIDILILERPLVELVLWCVVIGGIAASGQEGVQTAWFVTELNLVSMSLGLIDFAEVKAVLRHFSWVDSACDPGGQELWDEI